MFENHQKSLITFFSILQTYSNFFSFFRQNSILERKFKWDILSDFQTLCIEQIQNMKTKEIILTFFFVADVAHMQNLKCKKKSAFIFESRRSRRRF